MSGSLFYFLYLMLLYTASRSSTAVSPLPPMWSDGFVAGQAVLFTAVALLIAARQQQSGRHAADVDAAERAAPSLVPLAAMWLLCADHIVLAACGAIPFSVMTDPSLFPVSPLAYSAVSFLGYGALLFLPASLCSALLYHRVDGETRLSVASFATLLAGALLSIPALVLLHYHTSLPYTALLAINPVPCLLSLVLLCLLPCHLLYHRRYHAQHSYSPILDPTVSGWGEDGLGSGVSNGGGKYGKGAAGGKGKGWMSKQYQALLAGSELNADSEDDEEHVAIF